MNTPLNRAFTWYVETFVSHPYCVDCKEKMQYSGYMVCIASVLPSTKRRILVFRCEEDDREIRIYPNGSYTSWKDDCLE